MSYPAESESIKKPNVAGQFYDARPNVLTERIRQYLDQARADGIKSPIEMLIVPHAGHMYSGPVAAYGFKAVSQQNREVKTVILLGPTHHYRFDGIAIWPDGGFETPLGIVEVDRETAASILQASEHVRKNETIFAKDHVLEVELPFIQEVFPNARIVPMIMSRDASSEAVMSLASAAADAVQGRDDVLFIVSSDLSHFHPADEAKEIDFRGLDAVMNWDFQSLWNNHYNGTFEIDGFKEVMTGMHYAQKRGADTVKLLKYGHSGDISGDLRSVVGYGALAAFAAGSSIPEIPVNSADSQIDRDALTLDQKRRLMDIAKNAVMEYVRNGKTISFKNDDPRLEKKEGVFVTLRRDGKLRGCIGNIIGSGPVCQLVRDMAIAAAVNDPRFPRVTPEELPVLDVEVSVLSIPRKASADEIILGTHGVIISRGRQSGVFLPEVAAETGWSKDEFLGQLCSQKVRLPADCWKDPETTIQIFTTDKFTEKDLQ